MSRLTTSENETGYCNAPYCQEDCNTCMFFQAIRDKLAHYEDLEEAGRLITLPCAIGDTVWEIINLPEVFGREDLDLWDIRKTEFVLEDFKYLGVWNFLTKAEAEAKLAELKGGGDEE